MWTLRVKREDYGKAIAILLQRGGTFQTRFEHTLIVNDEQHRVLEQAGLVASNGTRKKARNINLTARLVPIADDVGRMQPQRGDRQ